MHLARLVWKFPDPPGLQTLWRTPEPCLYPTHNSCPQRWPESQSPNPWSNLNTPSNSYDYDMVMILGWEMAMVSLYIIIWLDYAMIWYDYDMYWYDLYTYSSWWIWREATHFACNPLQSEDQDRSNVPQTSRHSGIQFPFLDGIVLQPSVGELESWQPSAVFLDW